MRFRLNRFYPIMALFGAAFALTGLAAPVHAEPLLHAFIQDGSFGTVACGFSVGSNTPGGCNDLDAIGGPSVSKEATNGPNPLFPQARGRATATFGTLSNFAEGFSRASFFGNETVFANATFVIDDLIFTDLNETGATNVTTSLNVHVSGSIGGTINIPGGPNTQGTYSLSIFANGNAIGSGLVKGDIEGNPIANTGIFGLTGTSSSVNDVFATNGFTFDLNVPHSLRLTAFAKASAVSGSLIDAEQGDLASLLEANFGSTASFASTVFNLPDGITVNSQLAGINNNSFGASTVPEPAMLPLFALGVVGLVFVRRRRDLDAKKDLCAAME